MEIAANLLRLANEWIVAQVDEVEGETLPGDPDCILCLLYTSPSPRDLSTSRMPSSA